MLIESSTRGLLEFATLLEVGLEMTQEDAGFFRHIILRTLSISAHLSGEYGHCTGRCDDPHRCIAVLPCPWP